jgi:hypothetical protein
LVFGNAVGARPVTLVRELVTKFADLLLEVCIFDLELLDSGFKGRMRSSVLGIKTLSCTDPLTATPSEPTPSRSRVMVAVDASPPPPRGAAAVGPVGEAGSAAGVAGAGGGIGVVFAGSSSFAGDRAGAGLGRGAAAFESDSVFGSKKILNLPASERDVSTGVAFLPYIDKYAYPRTHM